ncbi:MAG: hypothetical protein U5N86_02955 [Planctomycetota bacterium]|nr:hypothetical protein [Planctomycetota bacterium]
MDGTIFQAITIDEMNEKEKEYYEEYSQVTGTKVEWPGPFIDPDKAVVLTDDYCPVDIWPGYVMLHRH